MEIKPIYEGKIVKIQSKPCYLIVSELHNYMGSPSNDPWVIKYAVSKSGDYIGDTKTAYRLVNKFGISVFERRLETSKVCSIGYNLSKRKWYGWSHRAIASFREKSRAKRFAESVS
jgi:hypothetical protein